MKQKSSFFISVCALAIPVTLQSMLQASFSMIDQIMIGQLGSVRVAGVGYAGKFVTAYTVIVAAVASVAGIMISQYLGQKNSQDVKRSFYLNLLIAFVVSAFFFVVCLLFPTPLMSFYTQDPAALQEASSYLSIITFTFIPTAGATLISTLLRCMEKPKLPLYASMVSAALNTGLNYVLIFGKAGFSPMGVQGAALATVIAQVVNWLIMLLMIPRKDFLFLKTNKQKADKFNWKQYGAILLPILLCDFLWCFGENVYASIYGHMSTSSGAAMTLMNPIVIMLIGALCGLSQAAGIIVGKLLGNKDYDEAYSASKKLIFYGFVGSVILSIVVALTASFYVQIYQVEETVRALTIQILWAFALVAPFKVLNMILSVGIIRSGGKTKYVMIVNIIGTWAIGVPLGLLSAFVCNLSIPYVYFLLSLEECVRFGLSLVVFHRKNWMQSLETTTQNTKVPA